MHHNRDVCWSNPSGGQNILLNLPIFLISFPVINSVGGNIGCILGSRIASGLHIGDITISINDKKMHENLITSLFMGIITYITLAILIYYIALFSGLTMSRNIINMCGFNSEYNYSFFIV